MAHRNNHIAAGAMPVIGRMFEAAAAAAPVARSTAAAAPALPFVGAVLDCRAGERITVARRLTLAHDLFLADHNFVHAPAVKALADCFPVVPMTASLEILAETAACLAPGYGLTGFEAVVARRWIAVVDGGELALRVEGRVASTDAGQASTRIAVQLFAGEHPLPAIEATVLFGAQYDAAPPAHAWSAPGGQTLDAARLYSERRLFHGPRFQGLHGAIELGPHSACAELRVLPAHDWFAAQPQPQLLCDPALLDAVGQLLGAWAMQQGGIIFPIGLGRLDLFGPTPAPGTLVPVSLRIVGRQLKMLSADVDIGDGAGGVWMRISGWKCWQFQWAAQLVAFQRDPAQFLLSDAQDLPAPLAGLVCRRLGAQRVAGFDLALLARHCLHASEMARFHAKAAWPQRQSDWLLGRVAAKDAARAWHARAGGGGRYLHPAAFAIDSDGAGQPRIACWPGPMAPPCISIAHSAGEAIAVADAAPLGIDIERVVARDDAFLASFSSVQERHLLAPWPGAERDAWVTRLWCAKEALGKRLGSGVTGAPQQFEAQALSPDGGLRLYHRPSGSVAHIVTVRDGDFVIAVDRPRVNP
ncbi:MAG: polyketide synthase dehydratase domain-containing protein [Pseudomonadota bacterium]